MVVAVAEAGGELLSRAGPTPDAVIKLNGINGAAKNVF